MTRTEAKRAIVATIQEKLRDWTGRGEYLTADSHAQLRAFALGNRHSLRLKVYAEREVRESNRAVLIALARQTREGPLAVRVKLEASAWSSPKGNRRMEWW